MILFRSLYIKGMEGGRRVHIIIVRQLKIVQQCKTVIIILYTHFLKSVFNNVRLPFQYYAPTEIRIHQMGLSPFLS